MQTDERTEAERNAHRAQLYAGLVAFGWMALVIVLGTVEKMG